jgi:RimJ/RimL family protein N-acetyltransferase
MAEDAKLAHMSDDVRLRDVEATDLEVFFEQEHDPEAVRRSKFSARDRDAFMTHWATKILADPTVFAQTVTVNGETAGNLVAWWEQDRRFLGYWLGRPYWSRGIGTNALTLFLRRERTRPLHADTNVDNEGSIRLLEKCGFRPAETVRHGEHESLIFVFGGHQQESCGRSAHD